MQIFWKEVLGTRTILVFSICFSLIQLLAIPQCVPCLSTVVAVQSLELSFLALLNPGSLIPLYGLKLSLKGVLDFLLHVYSFKWEN